MVWGLSSHCWPSPDVSLQPVPSCRIDLKLIVVVTLWVSAIIKTPSTFGQANGVIHLTVCPCQVFWFHSNYLTINFGWFWFAFRVSVRRWPICFLLKDREYRFLMSHSYSLGIRAQPMGNIRQWWLACVWGVLHQVIPVTQSAINW